MRYLWLAVVIASLALSAWSVRSRIAARPRVAVSPRASSDMVLSSLKLQGGSESLRQALAQIPEKEAIVFVGPGEDARFTEILFGISLLALPRQVGGLRCLKSGAAEMLVPLDADQKITAAVFYRWEPGTPVAERLAPDLALLRIPPQRADRPWTSFCSLPQPASF